MKHVSFKLLTATSEALFTPGINMRLGWSVDSSKDMCMHSRRTEDALRSDHLDYIRRGSGMHKAHPFSSVYGNVSGHTGTAYSSTEVEVCTQSWLCPKCIHFEKPRDILSA